MKKTVFLLLAVALIISSIPAAAFASDNDYAWVLVETQYRHHPDYNDKPIGTWSDQYHKLNVGERQHEIIIQREGRLPTDSPQYMHSILSWNAPPNTIRANQTVSVTVKRDVRSNSEGGWAGATATVVRHGPVGGNPKQIYFVAPDGNEYHTLCFSAYPSQRNTYYSVDSISVDFKFEFAGSSREGTKRFIDVYSSAASFITGERYIYEWKKVSSSTPIPSPSRPTTGGFSDLSANHWAHDTILEMVELGLLSGYPDGTFKPNNTISRAEFATIMVKALGLKTSRPGGATFSDVPKNHWAFEVVESSKDYLTGYRDTSSGTLTFEPSSVAVREDVAVAIVKAKGLGNASANQSYLNQFPDKGQISPALKDHVAIAVSQGYMRGSDIGFEPQKALTRAEACALLSNIIKQEGGREKIAF